MKKLLLILFIFICSPALAVQDYYSFKTADQEQQFLSLTNQLRCLVCQNQNLTESNAALAIDLREQIYQKIIRGQSSKEIIGYLTERYGNFILYKPPLNSLTLGLWLGPFLLLIMGISFLIFYVKKRER